ncbi:hypothetical protein TVAG_267340 [Trichomonas vaginalis G3]|uniref:Uncharacterized protein n=1 Tax=Trichomonas vaginalis (strain ATCC PRA-98 / G3) TaxID=412133 RepID=A2F572_TRIV3|nr:armadillo (ARM) repeat-containing protein family [Trichomonas vaginalis G3]EAX99965.1 hypothetical protein TVAG_267340 [Trichomonas vaginalis G3]KAI5516730.1 armadillo (ARM) repeat-containing protein family [Trichomonas vaginalis G3]|eukprot:XP_001312895.1 hypothetical protein [Trichomonas vaginalis G3]
MSESAANKLTNYLLDYIDEYQDSTEDYITEQRSLALEAISFIPKASEKHSKIYTLMEEYLKSDQQAYNESGLIVAQSVSLGIETIKNHLLKFLENKNFSILFNTISALISSSSVWDNDEDCCYFIIDKLDDLFNFGNGEIQDKSLDLLLFADPKSCRITEEIIDTLIEMLATKSPRVFEITQILINIVFNIMKGTLECGITLGEFQDKIWENETYINDALKGSQIAQEQYQKLAAVLQSGAEY